MNKGRDERCYLCNTPVRKYKLAPGQQSPADMRTHDHIPPENLFPEGMRRDLITVICCHTCNKAFSKLDEQFRVFVSTAINVSEVGKKIMRQKVFGRSLKESQKLKQQMARNVSIGMVMTNLGPLTVPLITMDCDVLNGFLIRLTKGLLKKCYPDIDYFGLHFAVSQLSQFGAIHPTFKEAAAILKADERGDGIFRFWHGIPQEQRTTGVWIYQFYDAVLFMVKHSKYPWPEGLTHGEKA